MAEKNKDVELIGFAHMPNGGNPPMWSDGTIGWDGKEELHRKYLEENKFKKLDNYDEQVVHDKSKQGDVKKSDVDRLKDEIDALDKLSDGPLMKERHVSNLLSDVDKKKNSINAQLNYMEAHKMTDTSLYKQLEGFATKLESIKNRLKNKELEE